MIKARETYEETDDGHREGIESTSSVESCQGKGCISRPRRATERAYVRKDDRDLPKHAFVLRQIAVMGYTFS